MIGRIFGIALVGTVGLLSGMLGLWVIDREPPNVATSYKIENTTVNPGQVLRVNVEGYRIRSCYTRIERYMFDSRKTRFLFPDVDYLDPGKPGHFNTWFELEVPQRAYPGVATLFTNVRWECNPIHSWWPIIRSQASISFVVN